MASIPNFTSEHRKQAFSAMNNHHPSWPTPPTETENDFAQAASPEDSKSTIRLPPLSENSESSIQSPPASPPEGWRTILPPIQSPPDSPATRPLLPSLADRTLFTEPSSDREMPLFSAQQTSPTSRADSLSPCDRAQPADKGIYSIFPQFRGADREFFRKYRDSCYAELRLIPGWRPITPRSAQSSQTSNAAHATRRPAALNGQAKITKPAAPLRTTTKPRPKVAKLMTASPRQAKTPTRTRERSTESAEPQARKRAPPSKPKVQEDHWQTIQDFSPPSSTLDNTDVKLHVHWKGQPNDLSNDPDVAHLHPQEIKIAQELKLPASQYLSNKRRIFEARVKSIIDRKNFTKTAAQQACNIDVNKTSQLFEAYDRVGWFREEHFKQFMPKA